MTSEPWVVFLMEVVIVRFLLSISQIVYVMIWTWWFILSSNFLFTYSYLSYLVVWLMCWNLSYGLCSFLFLYQNYIWTFFCSQIILVDPLWKWHYVYLWTCLKKIVANFSLWAILSFVSFFYFLYNQKTRRSYKWTFKFYIKNCKISKLYDVFSLLNL